MNITLKDGQDFSILETRVHLDSEETICIEFLVEETPTRLFFRRGDSGRWQPTLFTHIKSASICSICGKKRNSGVCRTLQANAVEFASKLVGHKGVRLFCAIHLKPRDF